MELSYSKAPVIARALLMDRDRNTAVAMAIVGLHGGWEGFAYEWR